MPKLVVHGAVLRCTLGAAPSTFAVATPHMVAGDQLAAGNVSDFVPSTNVPPFGLCRAPTNPQVASATSAAGGVLTPQPCVPVLATAWAPGSVSVTVDHQPALHDGCTCSCQWGGVLSVASAGQLDVDVD